MGRPREYEPDRINTQVRLPKALHGRVREEALRRDVSVNRIIVMALERFLGRKR